MASDDKVREMLHKVLYKNSIDEILIRAIVSQFNSWEDINELYITERAEKNKYLKNILASDDKVREMLHKVLYKKTADEIIDALQNYEPFVLFLYPRRFLHTVF